MNKYIDAERLKAEIERHIKEVMEVENRFHPNLGFFDAKLSGIYYTLSILDSLQQEQPMLPGIEGPGIPGKDFIPVEWVDACEMYGKWKIVKQEQPEVDLEKETKRWWKEHLHLNPESHLWMDAHQSVSLARHFYELGLNARKEESK